MLQLPTETGRRFTKAQVAELSRDDKVKVRLLSTRRDPIIAKIKRADRALHQLLEVGITCHYALEKLEQHDRGYLTVHPIDEPAIFREFGHGFAFCSEEHVARMFRIRRRQTRQRLADNRAYLKRSTEKRLVPSLEIEQRIDGEKRLLAALIKFEPAQRKAVRIEARRLHRVQRNAGLLDARKKKLAALKALRLATEKVAGMKPINRQGALAVIEYVRRRIFPDMAELFTEPRGVDANLWHLLQCAHDILEREQ